MFEGFPKLTRFSHDWMITEKIDGTNAQVLIVNDEGRGAWGDQEHDYAILGHVDGHFIYAGSRNKLLTRQSDNYGFAKFVDENKEELVAKLGEGRHFGEWCGSGIQRGYGMTEKQFVLFNATRWTGVDLPKQVGVVPILAQGYMDNPGGAAQGALAMLKQTGSVFAEGFMNPEGVVMRHGPSGTIFKKTFDYDEAGKWAEKGK